MIRKRVPLLVKLTISPFLILGLAVSLPLILCFLFSGDEYHSDRIIDFWMKFWG